MCYKCIKFEHISLPLSLMSMFSVLKEIIRHMHDAMTCNIAAKYSAVKYK